MARDGLGYILTGADAMASGKWPLKDREPCPLETTVPGILAAGDIRAGSTKRVGFAVGDGSLAVTCVHKLTAIRK
jgi:thioredoxin reductase (NADPH)